MRVGMYAFSIVPYGTKYFLQTPPLPGTQLAQRSRFKLRAANGFGATSVFLPTAGSNVDAPLLLQDTEVNF